MALPVAAGSVASASTSFDQQSGPLPAQEPARKILRHGDEELHIAQLQHSLTLGGAGDDVVHAEIAAVFHRPDEAAGKNAVIGGEHRRRQRLRIGVDGESEQDQLQDRNSDDHGESEPIPAHLNELLREHRDEARPGEQVH